MDTRAAAHRTATVRGPAKVATFVSLVASLLAMSGPVGAPRAMAATWIEAAPVASIQVIAATLRFTAYPGFANDVDVSPGELGKVEVIDSAGSIELIGTECVPSPTGLYPDKVTCDVTGVSTIELDGGDLGDVLDVRDPMSARLLGGSGDDSLFGLTGGDFLDGGSGDDLLFGASGDDLLIGGPGADDMSGGPGIDTVSYAGLAVGVWADADGQQGDDGAPGEGDTIHVDVENLVGGGGGDMLFGDPGSNSIEGGGGTDTIYGGPGNDTLAGGPGADRIYGAAGTDSLFGDAGYDLLDGGTDPLAAAGEPVREHGGEPPHQYGGEPPHQPGLVGAWENDSCAPGPDGAAMRNCEHVLHLATALERRLWTVGHPGS